MQSYLKDLCLPDQWSILICLALNLISRHQGLTLVGFDKKKYSFSVLYVKKRNPVSENDFFPLSDIIEEDPKSYRKPEIKEFFEEKQGNIIEILSSKIDVAPLK